MKLARDEFEQMFGTYREHLRKEIHCFRDSVSVLRQISDRTQDHLSEINLAPGFFHVVEDALFNTIIVWADKLLDEKGQRGMFHFLTLIENNREWLAVSELQRRKGYPDGHWMLKDREPVTFKSIEAHRGAIRSLAALPKIKTRRDKYQAHFDKDYFFDRTRLNAEASVTWEEIENVGKVMGGTLNDYSSDFDGAFFSWEAPGDLRRLLLAAQSGQRHSA